MKCCVPQCKGKLDSTATKPFVFKFPLDNQELRDKWIRSIQRKDFIPNKSSRVCELHFRASEIERETTVYDIDTGEKLKAPLRFPRLTKNAVPSIFPGCPSVSPEKQIKNRFEEIERDIKRILPSLEEKTVKRVLERLDDLGVENYSHLSLIEEQDLKDVLKVIQIRLLLASWKSNNPVVTPQSFNPNITTTSDDHIAVTVDERGYIIIPQVNSLATNLKDPPEKENVHLPIEDESFYNMEDDEEENEECRCPNANSSMHSKCRVKKRPFKPVPLPNFSPILEPLLQGHALSESDHKHLSSMLKSDLIDFLNEENLIRDENSSVVRWLYRDLGETLKRKYPNMIWDTPSLKQIKVDSPTTPIYKVFIKRLSMRRKQKILRGKLKPRLEELTKEDALVELEQKAVDSRSVNPSASTSNSVMPMPNPLTVAAVPDSELLLTSDLVDDRSDSERFLEVQIKIEPEDTYETLLHPEENNTNSVPTELTATTNGGFCPQPIVLIKKEPITN